MANPPKKTPFRKCVGCGEMKPKQDLIRVVKTPEGEIRLDKTGRLNGRGAYICDDKACFAKCRKQKRLDKAFGESVPDTVYAQLEQAVENV
ncbi:MAG: YlxR family protein [Clostridia bacterium]|nr:YlxR family protein [Clostridia bacterium]